jgi:NADH:ubiquinone oxidoreductase subunit 2 (subunit N)
MEVDLNKRYQTMIILWFALLMSIGMYFFVSVFAGPEIQPESGNPRSSILTVVLTALGFFLVIVSFAVKQKILRRSVDQQDVNLVQKALVVACVICEATALLGVIERFTVSNRDYYLLFILAAAGIALHFPKRSQLEAASYKQRSIVNGK